MYELKHVVFYFLHNQNHTDSMDILLNDFVKSQLLFITTEKEHDDFNSLMI